ncbi:multicopper oxidase domain-containing protein [Parafrigoribacterium soli]|uniref:multicopper oxidase domain-containing protein n=1 Tax=Parafrigoribacterium soli TaxID=3144663 RepID=UPI0032EA9EC8
MSGTLSRRRWYLLMNGLVAVWLVAAGVIVIVHRFVPAGTWLMVHLLLLGAVSTAILVWSQHFADSLLRRPAPGGRRFHGIRLVGHSLGAVLVVAGIVSGWWPLVLAGGILIGIVAIAHATSLTVQLRGGLPARFAPLVHYYIAAGLSLVVGVTLGVIMARSALPAAVHDRLFPAHIGFNLLGWVGITVVGTFILLWPTVLGTRASDTAKGTARSTLVLLIGGILLYGLFCLADLRVGIAAAVIVYVAGIVLMLVDAARQARRAPPSSFAAWSLAAAMAWFVVCALGLGILVATARNWADADDRLAWLVGPFAVGFAAQIVLGAMSYLLPVVFGGGPDAARRSAAELNRGGVFRVVVVNLGIVVYLLPASSLVRVVMSLLVFLVLVSFLPLAVRAALASRRAPSGADAMVRSAAPAPTPARHSGSLVVAAGTLILAMTIGVALDPAASGLSIGVPSGGAAASGQTTTVEMTMKNMRFSPSTVEVPVGNKLVIKLRNADDQVHDLTLATGITSGRLAPGESATVDVGVVGAGIEGWCSVAGHRLLGMVMKIVATGGPAAAESSTGSTGSRSGHDMAAMPGMGGTVDGPSAAKDIDPAKKPGKDFVARDAVLAPAASETVHKLTLTVSDLQRAVAPGITQSLWTYNGTAPGPTLHGKIGDVFDITLVNDGTIGHSIDFHAGSLAPDRPMRTIDPGQSLTYRFTATRSGIWLYHCSTMPMSVHIANGMFGAVIIDPPGLSPVDREYVLVQSEYYLGPQKGEVDAAKVATEKPDLVVFNGYANQYRYSPLTAKVGERVRIWVLDAGPNRPSSFHLVGGQFDTVFSEGDYLLRNGGSTGTGGAQALALQPAQGGFVEFTLPEAGNYSFVTHVMSDAEKGAAGTLHVTE